MNHTIALADTLPLIDSMKKKPFILSEIFESKQIEMRFVVDQWNLESLTI